MSEWNELLGNQNNISHIKEAAALGRLPHAYIIHGAEGSGKKTFASYTAAALLCDRGVAEGPCGICSSCIKAKSRNHPDIIYTTHEKPGVLSVQEVREQVVGTVSIAPYYGPYKIYVIRDAQLLNEHGQNALLKTIEEPPEYVRIFILTDNADALLDTIRSRCIRLDMEGLSRETVEKALEEKGISKGTARECAAFARGNLGTALSLASEGELREWKDETVKMLKNLKHTDALEIFSLSSETDRESGRKILDIMLKWYRDLLMVKTGGESAGLYFENDKAVLKRQAEILTFEGIGRIMERIPEAGVRLQGGVKPEAVFETLYLKIREEYQQKG